MNVLEKIRSDIVNAFNSSYEKVSIYFEKERKVRSYSIELCSVKFPRIVIGLDHTTFRIPKNFASGKRRADIYRFFNFISELYTETDVVLRGQLIRGVVEIKNNRKFVGEYSLSKFLKGEYNEII